MAASPSRSSKPAWQTTWLWETLEKRSREKGNTHAYEFLPDLTRWMRQLDTVLRAGGTSPLDFTLHDADHSLRVAHRIYDLLTPTVRRNLSDYELALLLLAAYGHDIGMTPARGKVLAHHRHLFGHDTSLSYEEKQLYQTFLDEYPEHPVTLPLGTTPAHLDLADELTTYYVRERHNDWSAAWLRENLIPDNFGHLPNVIHHLTLLCSSHHWGFPRLRQDDFDPILTTGPQPQLVHLRFLACLLRLADILENDPERTPPVLLAHRGIHERKKSLTYWRRDRSFTVDIRQHQLHFQARPPDAHVHKAALQLADWIDHELHGIASLGERMPTRCQVGKKPVERDWHLPAALTRDVRPADASYEYIEGAFRPNTARLLQLLSNEQLYGTPLAAVRELLQNAFDAVREKIARTRLTHPAPDIADRKWEQYLGDSEKVTLTLRPGDHGRWHLICEDTGVGLTKEIITGHLLVSGNSRRHAILDLERRCTAAGFPLGRTGQFGIGVLSYFMLADQVEVTTTRAQLCGDPDAPGWTFTTRGVGSFGELRPLKTAPFNNGGARVVWEIKPDQITDSAKFAKDLLKYLKKTLVRIPCRFEFKTEGIPGDQIQWLRSTGWVKTEEDWLEWAKEDLDAEAESIFGEIPTESETSEPEDFGDRLAAKLPEIRSSLRVDFLEKEAPDQSGLMRYALVYWETSEGRTISPFGQVDPPGFSLRILDPDVISWRGMEVYVSLLPDALKGITQFYDSFAPPQRIFVEADFVTLGSAQLSVNRKSLDISRETIERWNRELRGEPITWVKTILAGGAANSHHEDNMQSLGHYFERIDLADE